MPTEHILSPTTLLVGHQIKREHAYLLERMKKIEQQVTNFHHDIKQSCQSSTSVTGRISKIEQDLGPALTQLKESAESKSMTSKTLKRLSFAQDRTDRAVQALNMQIAETTKAYQHAENETVASITEVNKRTEQVHDTLKILVDTLSDQLTDVKARLKKFEAVAIRAHPGDAASSQKQAMSVVVEQSRAESDVATPSRMDIVHEGPARQRQVKQYGLLPYVKRIKPGAAPGSAGNAPDTPTIHRVAATAKPVKPARRRILQTRELSPPTKKPRVNDLERSPGNMVWGKRRAHVKALKNMQEGSK